VYRKTWSQGTWEIETSGHSLTLPLPHLSQELMAAHARIAELEGGGGAEEHLNG
jgi:hypothetical protein